VGYAGGHVSAKDECLEMTHGLGSGRNGKCAPRNAHPAHSLPPTCKEHVCIQAAHTSGHSVTRSYHSPRAVQETTADKAQLPQSCSSEARQISASESFKTTERTGEIAAIPLPARGAFSTRRDYEQPAMHTIILHPSILRLRQGLLSGFSH
jgi:hypothetical protein